MKASQTLKTASCLAQALPVSLDLLGHKDWVLEQHVLKLDLLQSLVLLWTWVKKGNLMDCSLSCGTWCLQNPKRVCFFVELGGVGVGVQPLWRGYSTGLVGLQRLHQFDAPINFHEARLSIVVTQIRFHLTRSSFFFLLHRLSYISIRCPSISPLKTPWLIIRQYERLLLVKIFCLSFCPSSPLWQICPSCLWKLSIATWSLLVWMTSSQLTAEPIQLTTLTVISGL